MKVVGFVLVWCETPPSWCETVGCGRATRRTEPGASRRSLKRANSGARGVAVVDDHVRFVSGNWPRGVQDWPRLSLTPACKPMSLESTSSEGSSRMQATMRTGLRLNAAVVIVFFVVSTLTVFGNPRIGSATNEDSSDQSSGSSGAASAEIQGAAPFRPPFADNRSHDHVSVERNSAERANWQPRFDGPGGEDNYEPTDLTFTKASSYYSSVDVYWYVTYIPGHIGGTYECKAWASSTRCDRSLIKIADDAVLMSDLLQNNLVCHELGHSVGFRDGGTAGASCMTGGDNNKLAWWEIQKINFKY